MNKRLTFTLGAFLLVAAASLGVFFYARGFQFNPHNGTVERTGMILIKSYPDGAKIFIDGKLVTASPSPISGLKPKNYKVTIEKEGYAVWEKIVPVEAELVTSISALLVSKTPELKPLTSTGAYSPTLSPRGGRILYGSKNNGKPGLWVLPLGTTSFNIFRSSPYLIAQDSREASFSAFLSAEWSPEENEALIQTGEEKVYLVNTLNPSTPQLLSPRELESVKTVWKKKADEERLVLSRRFKLAGEAAEIATASATATWAPDEKKLFYIEKNSEGEREYQVLNFEDPLGVGEKEHCEVLRIPESRVVSALWHTDSMHLILVEGSTISILETDGENLTQVYSGNLASSFVAAHPDGDKLIILTKFNEDGKANLYSLSLR